MKYGIALIERLRAMSSKSDGPDMFDLRLQRTRSRENRRNVPALLFKIPREPQEA